MVLIVNCRKALKTLWFLLSAKQSNRQFLECFFFKFLSIYSKYVIHFWTLKPCIIHMHTQSLYKQNFLFSLSFPLLFIPRSPTCDIFIIFFCILPKVLAIFLHSYFYWDTFFKVRVTTLRGEQWLSFYHGPTEITPWYSIKWYKTFSSISCDVSEGVL